MFILVNKILHGCLQICNLSSCVENSKSNCAHVYFSNYQLSMKLNSALFVMFPSQILFSSSTCTSDGSIPSTRNVLMNLA